jgi:hypothetical protein
MAAWDAMSRSWGGLIQPLSSHGKRVLCLDAIALCLASLAPSPEEALGADAALLARRELDLLRKAAGDSPPGVPGGEILGVLRAPRQAGSRPAAASLATALTGYADAVGGSLDACDVLLVMSACYEAVLHCGRDNPALPHLLTAQRALIAAAALA